MEYVPAAGRKNFPLRKKDLERWKRRKALIEKYSKIKFLSRPLNACLFREACKRPGALPGLS
jgi:hypothetical protein